MTNGRPVSVPIYQTSIFEFEDAEAVAEAMSGPDGDFAYSGYTNPTVRALEDTITALEGGAAALATGTGMGAISSVLMALLRPGDHVVAQRCLYGGTLVVLADLAERWGVEVSYISGDTASELTEALRPTTKLLCLETIANPTGRVPDLPGLTEVATGAGVITMVDNTFATPMLCRPIEHGADVVVHSATKYLGGHHDVSGGIAVFADPDLYRSTWSKAITMGTPASPFAAWLVTRGVKTLPLRVARHCETAGLLAARLAEHPAVDVVHYPGLATDPSHAMASRLLSGYGGTVAFDLPGGRAAAFDFARALRLVKSAGSLGGTETVVMHPATTSHRHIDAAGLEAAGIKQGTVRIATGLEHADDLWADIAQALSETKAGEPGVDAGVAGAGAAVGP
jgi:cystathionine beta-lyase/cystathionine gamma-synthase